MLVFLKPKAVNTSRFSSQKDSQVHDATNTPLLWIILATKTMLELAVACDFNFYQKFCCCPKLK